MADKVQLPYFAPEESLPAPLPTVAEIKASPFKISSKVVRINEHFVAKFDKNRSILREGENLLFVRQATSIPVPTVYALFRDESGVNFLVSEYIPGTLLQDYWRDADKPGKDAVVAQLRRYFGELRSLPPPGYFGGIWRQSCYELFMTGVQLDPDRDLPRTTGETHIGPCPPCDTEEQWVDRMLHVCHARFPDITDPNYNVMRRAYQSVFRGHKAVFTHADLDKRNIIVRPDNTLVMIDWERSGWYPAFWEFCVGLLIEAQTSDFSDRMPEFLEEYWAQMGWMYYFHNCIMFSGI